MCKAHVAFIVIVTYRSCDFGSCFCVVFRVRPLRDAQVNLWPVGVRVALISCDAACNALFPLVCSLVASCRKSKGRRS
eukprot:scaffold120935_cov29-Tisochrysis_lutea.AAC.1